MGAAGKSRGLWLVEGGLEGVFETQDLGRAPALATFLLLLREQGLLRSLDGSPFESYALMASLVLNVAEGVKDRLESAVIRGAAIVQSVVV